MQTHSFSPVLMKEFFLSRISLVRVILCIYVINSLERGKDNSAVKEIATLNELGETIRAERRRQGLTQDELAQLSGVGINFVSQIERGKPTAEIGKVFAVLRMLGIVSIAERRREWRRISKFIESGEDALV